MIYIVLFIDGSMQFYRRHPDKGDFGSVKGVYQTSLSTHVYVINDWVANNHSHAKIQEIGFRK